ncbi:VOC family protein [Lentzea tibetensis]|uniref:VOC family protein n=1 Tax=Lentzea tibetensis TaxID=2591470 RepID=A0A563EYZ0_9PSEU|nr:VOC family protein [Lentzea tibetensis]TWP52889.1 VOC family protein [Lentzea tibetensis]
MTTNEQVKTIPDGYTTVTPWIITRDTNAQIEFMTKAFDAEEIFRVVGEDGTIGHAEARIGTSIVMMFDSRDHWIDTPAFLRLYLDDADATFEKAINAGATAVTRMTHAPWGERVGRILDPQGNLWWLHTRIENVDEAELARRAEDPKFVEAMNYIQGSDIIPRR